jgi:ribosomal protein L9
MKEEDNKQNAEQSEQPKKLSQADAIKRILEQKKQAQLQNQGGQKHHSTGTKKMTNQINKKPNNQKKRMGV